MASINKVEASFTGGIAKIVILIKNMKKTDTYYETVVLFF